MTEHPATAPAPPIPVSVIVLTRDEEANIAKCLASVARFETVFVVDSGSTDRTVAIARAWGAEVVPFRWDGTYPKKKQWCLERLPLRHDWVLYVDADEELYPELTDEIGRLMADGPDHLGYFARFDGWFAGRKLRHGIQNVKLVLFNRHKARFPEFDDLDATRMWEVEGHYQPHVEGSVGLLRARALHADFKPSFAFFERMNRYSDWEAVVRLRGGPMNTGESQLPARRLMKGVFQTIPLKGLAAFVYSYVVRRGFLDGAAGFHFAVARMFYYWQIGRKMEERKRERR